MNPHPKTGRAPEEGPEEVARQPFWPSYRALFPSLARLTYLNNASIQPLPEPVARRLHAFVDAATHGDPEELYGPDVYPRFRATVAAWLGCGAGDLALATSNSDGFIKAVNAVTWRPGDEVVIPHNEFPSVVYPFKMAEEDGATVRFAGEAGRPVTEEHILAALRPRTRAVAFSWVSFSTGYRLDLEAFPKELKRRGVEVVFVDGMQGAGVWNPRLSATEVDFFCFQGVKWMAGPNGAGVLYIRPGLLGALRNRSMSWFSVPCCEDYSLLTDTGLAPFPAARAYDGGTPVIMAITGVQAYLDLLEPVGVDGVAERMEAVMGELADRLAEARISTLLPIRRPNPSSIALLEVPDAAAAHARLHAAGIRTSVRMGRVRVSPHLYSDASDFDRLAAVLGGRP